MKRIIIASVLIWCVPACAATLLEPNIALNKDQRAEVVDHLRLLLADEVVLATALQNGHWNVRGPLFGPLHELFADQYKEIASQIDDIAERIRMLGDLAPATLEEFKELTRLQENPGYYPSDAADILKDLLALYEQLIGYLRPAVDAAREVGDAASENFFAELLWHHEKAAWMLRAHLE